MKRTVIVLLVSAAGLSSCWLPSSAEYRARKNRPRADPAPPPFELHRPERPFETPPPAVDSRSRDDSRDERANGDLGLVVAPRIDRLAVSGSDDDERFGRVGETHRNLDETRVVELVRDHVAPGTWDDDGISIDAENGVLFVRHAPDVQRDVRRFLRQLGG